MNINQQLKNRRIELKLTLEDVAKIVGVSGATISRWESGDIENMKRDKIALLAKALKVTPSFIMGWDESETDEEDDDLLIINRNAKKMTPEQRKQLIEMAKIMFKEDFE